MVKAWTSNWEIKHWSWETSSLWWWIMLWRNSPPTEMQTKPKIAKRRSVKANLFLWLSMFLDLLSNGILKLGHCQYIMRMQSAGLKQFQPLWWRTRFLRSNPLVQTGSHCLGYVNTRHTHDSQLWTNRHCQWQWRFHDACVVRPF